MEKMFYVLERVFGMTHIPVHYFDNTGKITIFSLVFEKESDPLAGCFYFSAGTDAL